LIRNRPINHFFHAILFVSSFWKATLNFGSVYIKAMGRVAKLGAVARLRHTVACDHTDELDTLGGCGDQRGDGLALLVIVYLEVGAKTLLKQDGGFYGLDWLIASQKTHIQMQLVRLTNLNGELTFATVL
jgi:hypothetical protein